jgi:hypothetical protein
MYTLTASDAHQMSKRWEQQLQRLSEFMGSLGATSGDVQDLIVKVIAFRDTHPIHLDQPSLDVIDCEELIELGFLVESTITSELGVEFIDRIDEVKKLISLEDEHDTPFWLLDAPARYGKTFFLFEVRKQLLERHWQVRYFSFKEYPQAAWDRIHFLRDFRRTFDKTFKEPWPKPSVEQLRDRLVADLGNSPDPLAIFIDDAELVEEKAIVDWIKKFLDDVWHARMGTRFQGMVSGRYISPKWYEDTQVYPLFDKQISIGSLGIQYTQEMIDRICKRFNIAKPSGNAEVRQTTARMVQMIAAGCPECTINLLIDIGRDTAFNPTRSFFDKPRREQLFNQHVAPICEAVLAEIEDPFTRKYYPYLCILRRYNSDLLADLLRFLQTELFHEPVDETGPGRMDTVINRSGLVMPDINRGFKGDNNIRQLFGLQKWLFDENVQRVNDWAMRYFERQITQKTGSIGILYNREAFVEYMYHYVLNLRARKPTRDQACLEFNETLAKACRRLEAFSHKQGVVPADWESHKTDLVKGLKKDVEIRDQLAHLGVSGADYAQLYNLS